MDRRVTALMTATVSFDKKAAKLFTVRPVFGAAPWRLQQHRYG
jgi:hypothetical protein